MWDTMDLSLRLVAWLCGIVTALPPGWCCAIEAALGCRRADEVGSAAARPTPPTCCCCEQSTTPAQTPDDDPPQRSRAPAPRCRCEPAPAVVAKTNEYRDQLSAIVDWPRFGPVIHALVPSQTPDPSVPAEAPRRHLLYCIWLC
ncbi:MAG: hypothetical protein NZO58_07745 [Gemmataceae bacterium]|nr:hypothetical protein [Gemmataceae bacterium]